MARNGALIDTLNDDMDMTDAKVVSQGRLGSCHDRACEVFSNEGLVEADYPTLVLSDIW